MDPNVIVQVQTPQILTWAFCVMALSLVGIAGTLVSLARRLSRIETGLEPIAQMAARVEVIQTNSFTVKTMHEHADDFGFGTKATNQMLAGLVDSCSKSCQQGERVWRAIEQLAHVMRHDVETRTGRKIPPPGPEVPM